MYIYINKSMRGMYHHGVWLGQRDAQNIAMNGINFLRTYATLAWMAHEKKLSKFPMQPKFHYLNHTWLSLLTQSKKRWSLNPIVYSCQMQEDYIGRPSRLSRRCNPRSVSTRVLQRSFAATRQCLRFLVADGSK